MFRRWSDESGVPLLLVYLNFRQDPHPEQMGTLFRHYAKKVGLRYLDMRKACAGYPVEDLMVFKNDYHPNAKANAIFANVLGRRLEQNNLIPR